MKYHLYLLYPFLQVIPCRREQFEQLDHENIITSIDFSVARTASIEFLFGTLRFQVFAGGILPFEYEITQIIGDYLGFAFVNRTKNGERVPREIITKVDVYLQRWIDMQDYFVNGSHVFLQHTSYLPAPLQAAIRTIIRHLKTLVVAYCKILFQQQHLLFNDGVIDAFLPRDCQQVSNPKKCKEFWDSLGLPPLFHYIQAFAENSIAKPRTHDHGESYDLIVSWIVNGRYDRVSFPVLCGWQAQRKK
jgi:hypothetical protein